MKATIDHHGGWFRWSIIIGDRKFAEGKCGTFSCAFEMCYVVVSIFNRGEIKPLAPKPPFASQWEDLEWIETPKALEMAAREVEQRMCTLISVKRQK